MHKKQIYYTRAPLRVGISGGGTDFEEFINYHNSHVINATVSLFNSVSLKILKTKEILFISKDLNIKEKFNTSNILKKTHKLKLHYYCYIYMMEKFNNSEFISLELQSYCAVPMGSGLGSSSTLAVAIIKVISDLLKLKLSKKKLAFLAYDAERNFANIKGGKQDHYSATYGGVNEFIFSKNNFTKVNKIGKKNIFFKTLEKSLVLAYYPLNRNAPIIIENQKDNFKKKRNKMFNNSFKMKSDTLKMKNIIRSGNFKKFISIFNNSWINKKKLSKYISNSKIDNLLELSLKQGALAAKISGAGGGGFFIFISNILNKKKLITFLINQKLKIYECKFTNKGVESWKSKI